MTSLDRVRSAARPFDPPVTAKRYLAAAHPGRIALRPAPLALALAAALAAVAVDARAQASGEAVQLAQAAAAAPQDRGEGAPASLKTVVVTATRSAAEELGVPASVTAVRSEQLEKRNVSRFGDALVEVPGLYVRGPALGGQVPGSGQAVLSLRGVPRTPRTLVMIDGQPINNALTGGVDVAGISLESIERVEVVRGPYSASYGGNAMGGVINFITAGPDDPLTELRLGAGSMRQRGASLVHRKRYEGGLGVTLSLGYRESAGYDDSDYVVKALGPGAGAPVTGGSPTETTDGSAAWWAGTKGARPWVQQGGSLAFHHSPTERTKLVAGVSWNEYSIGRSRPDSFLRDAAGNPVFAGTVSPASVSAQRFALAETDFLTVSPSGEQDFRMFLRGEHRFEGGSELRANLGTQRHDFDFVMATPRSAATYDAGPGELTTQPNSRTDFDLSLRTPMSDRWVLTTGVAFNRSSLDRRTFALANWRDPDDRGALRTAGRGTSNNAAVFFQSEHFLGNALTAYLGGRYDRFETQGQVIQTSPPAFEQSIDSRSFSEFSPKLALVWQATPSLSLRGSYGEGFRPPALFDLYSRSTFPTATAGVIRVVEASPDLEPERIQSLELGADLVLAGRGTASVTVYRQRLSDLIYRRTITPTLSRTENAGEADVDGIEASMRWATPVKGLAAFGSLTHQFRYEISRNDAVPGSVGKNLTDVPQTMWAAGVEYDGGAWTGLLAYRYVSRVFASSDDQNLNTSQGVYGAYDAHGIWSAKVGYRVNRNLGLSLAVDNIGDRDYFVFSKQPGRTVYGEVAYRF